MEIAIQFKPNTSYSDKYSIFPILNAREDDTINDDFMIIWTPLEDYEEIERILQEFSFIERIEKSVQRKSTFVSTDPSLSSQWHLSNTAPGMGAVTAWNNGNVGSNNVYVAVFDTGCFRHDDLIDNFGIVPNETMTGRVDSNQNGYKNDYYGWNFYAGNNVIFTNPQNDNPTNKHGTYCSGIIGAKGNVIGGVGVCWNVSLIQVVVFNNVGSGASNFDIARGINYVIGLKNAGMNIVAINMSYSSSEYSFIEASAINSAKAAGILCVCAAGNDGINIDTTPRYPAAYPYDNIISVGAITSTGAIADYSNFGATSVDLFAPGSGIYTTRSLRGASPAILTSDYIAVDGTSYAAPCVTGAAALYKSKYPSATYSQIRTAILNAVTTDATYTGKCVTGGYLNVRTF